MKVQFEAEALIEYQDAAQYTEDHFGSGAKFVAAMRTAQDSIAADPTRFQSIGQGIRIFRLKRQPYYLFYYYDDAAPAVTIDAVAHHMRQQNFWRARLEQWPQLIITHPNRTGMFGFPP